jgi:hypothetical protein
MRAALFANAAAATFACLRAASAVWSTEIHGKSGILLTKGVSSVWFRGHLRGFGLKQVAFPLICNPTSHPVQPALSSAYPGFVADR